MRRALAVAFTAVLMLVPAAVEAAPGPPDVSGAAAAVVVDAADGEVMFQSGADERRAVASTTKLMTALLALERAEPTDVFRAPRYEALPAESRIDLVEGERMTVEDLLEALLLESANDAAVTIAEGVSGSREAFVEDMNARAAELGLEDTSYANPIGLDHPDAYSTARDLAALAVHLLGDERFAEIVDMPSAVLESGARRRVVANRNELVASHGFVDGVKTGHTSRAGHVLIGAASGGGAKVVSVVLGEPGEAARDSDTLELLRWGLARFRRVRALLEDRVVARVEIEHRDELAALIPRRGMSVTARGDQLVRRRVDAPEELEGPIEAGTQVGTVTVLRDGEPVRRIALVTAAEVPGAGPLRVLLSVLGVPLTLLALLGIVVIVTLAAFRLRVRLRLVRGRGEATRAP